MGKRKQWIDNGRTAQHKHWKIQHKIRQASCMIYKRKKEGKKKREKKHDGKCIERHPHKPLLSPESGQPPGGIMGNEKSKSIWAE